MKEKRREFDEDKITGFLDQETELKGDLSFKGSFRIDGRFKGNINSSSVLVVGEHGQIEADIKVGTVIIDGQIKGNIQAKERVEIHSKGHCQTTDKIPPQTPPEKTPKSTPEINQPE